MASNKQSTYKVVNVVCAVIFCAFTFCYLYFFQSDTIAYAQHILSGGLTTYNPLVGAVIMTIVVMICRSVTSLVTQRRLYFLPALYCLPPALMLASLTDIHLVEVGSKDVFGSAWIWCLIMFGAFVVVCQVLKRLILPSALTDMLTLMRNMALNLALMIGMMIFVLCCGNSEEKQYLDLHAETLLNANRYDEASAVGMKQKYCDDHLLTTRAYAMAKTNSLGEDFFVNCTAHDSECLLPSAENPMRIFPSERIYKMLGGVKPADMSVQEYLRLLHKRSMLKEGGRDYLYVSALLERNLDAFVAYYAERYDSTTVVPKHYREALTLYNHLRAQPVIDYSVPEMEADYADFQSMMHRNGNETLRMNALRQNYGDTYWYYYFNRSSF